MSKVTVVGAGNVGATCANVLAFNEVADEVVMLDVKEGVSEGKAMDMMQTAQLLGFDTTIVGCTNDYALEIDICPKCGGTGLSTSGRKCAKCKGTGYYHRKDE